MSFQDKSFWMLNGDVGYDNSSRIEPKHAHYWFMDAPEPEFFSNKKQALETVNNRPMSGFSNANVSLWENNSSFEMGSGLFCDHLFGSQPIRTFGLAGQNISSVGARNSNTETRAFEDQPNDSSINLSTLVSMGPTFNKGESNFVLMGNNVNKGDDSIVSINPAYNKGYNNFFPEGISYNNHNENFIPVGPGIEKGDDNFFPLGICYNNHNENFISVGPGIEKGDDNNVTPVGPTHDRVASSVLPIGTTYESGESKGANTSIGSFQNETQGNNQLGMIINSYDLLMNQPPEVLGWKISIEGKASPNASVAPVATSKIDKVRKNKEPKYPKKTSPNSFPSNVKSLLSTGILDGVPVKYVSWGRDALNAYEFERHAGCKTKHPNNHIYVKNGKTIYAVVQELKNTSQENLFEAIQTVTGSPINEKNFHIWKASYQNATRELQRIYGKNEVVMPSS
ncbi:hypothetical protein LguiB_029547 [Lonicera macranthoides]